MMNKVKILDYENNIYETDVDIEDVNFIIVTVISGDEILSIFTKDDKTINIDSAMLSGNFRFMDLYDYQYIVPTSDLAEWNERKNVYDWEDRNWEDRK